MQQSPREETASQLRDCFFIFDDKIEDERAIPEECPLFFHPAGVPINQKLFLMGYVQAMTAFVREFSGQTVQVITLQSSKMAVVDLGPKTMMVLTGGKGDSDAAIMAHVNDLREAFRFFNGSTEIVADGVPNRATLLTKYARLGVELLNLVSTFHAGTFASFTPMPYTLLPPKSKRIVVSASQLLNAVRRDEANHGAVLLHTDPTTRATTVLCSHLPITITRWIQARMESWQDNRSQQQQQQQQQQAGSPMFSPEGTPDGDRDRTVGRTYFSPVFVPVSVLQQLDAEKALCVVVDGEGEASVDDAVDDVHPPGIPQDPADGSNKWVGLWIMTEGDLALAVLMDKRRLQDRRIKKLQLECTSKLVGITRVMTTVLRENEGVASAAASGSGRGSMNASVGLASSASSNSGLDDLDEGEVHYVDFESPGHTLKTSPATPDVSYDRFAREASEAHGLFAEQPEVLQLLLEDHQSATLCRHTFGHEVFFKYTLEPTHRKGPPEGAFLGVESRARTVMEHQVDRKLL